MSTPYLPGKFVGFELLTQEIDKAVKFYDGLFGWHAIRVPMGDGEPYPMINNGDQAIGGYRKGAPGVKSHWVSYLSVPDVDASPSAAVAAGCRIMMAPTNFGSVGRAAAMADPTGASFCVRKGTNGDPPDVEKTPMPDCDKTARKVAALGGELATSPRDIPGTGRFGIAVDTTGAAVAFITPKSS